MEKFELKNNILFLKIKSLYYGVVLNDWWKSLEFDYMISDNLRKFNNRETKKMTIQN